MTSGGGPTSQNITVPVSDRQQIFRCFVALSFGQVKEAVLADVEVGRKLHVGPLPLKFSGGVEDLDTVVFPIADVDQSVRINPKAMQ